MKMELAAPPLGNIKVIQDRLRRCIGESLSIEAST